MSRHRLALLLLALLCGGVVRAGVTSVDICVYGATSGGIAAAVQASRMGKSVVLLAPGAYVGGMTSGGLSAADLGNVHAIGGISAEYLRRVGTRYGLTTMASKFEPRIAEEEFLAMLATANVPVRYHEYLAGVTMQGTRIAEITTESGEIYRAKMFLDTTYEGDLMAAAGVSWTVGRESTAAYGESLAGVGPTLPDFQFNTVIDPYVTPGVPASGLLPGVQPGDGGIIGSGDTKLQAFNYRLCLTNSTNPAKRIEFTAPPGYTPATYEVLARHLAANPSLTYDRVIYFATLPNAKADINSNGPFSTDMVGANYDYPTASRAQREQIAQAHRHYIQGLIYFLCYDTSGRVPASIRTEMRRWALAADEFTSNGGWPYQFYVREARRMVSDYVMQESDCLRLRIAADSIGLASYQMDSHVVQRFVKLTQNGNQTVARVYNEGMFFTDVPRSYHVSLRSVLPRQTECENLAVPFALSASHVAFGSLRMEPVFMILSQSATTAAAFAIDANCAIQQVPFSQLAPQLRADKQVLGSLQLLDSETVLDDAATTGVTISGTWTSSTALAGYIGTSYLVSAADGGAANRFITFTPEVRQSGLYFVQMRWTSNPNRASNVPVEIVHANGTFTRTLDQRSDGGTWYSITGTTPLYLNAGFGTTVTLRTQGANGVIIADAVRLVTATPHLDVLATDNTAREINPGDAARFTVVRDPSQTTSAWAVNYTVSGTATPGADFTPLTGSVVIPAGEVSATIAVQPVSDSVVEGTETVTVTLLPTAAYDLGTYPSATVQLLDKPLLQITATDLVARELTPTDTATFSLSRSAADATAAWTVNYAVTGTATAGADFVTLPGTLVLPVGVTSAELTISAIPDLITEGPETVTLTLLSSSQFAATDTGSATVQIADKPLLRITATDPSIQEAAPGDTGTFTVSRDMADAAVEWVASYTVSGTATPNVDYAGLGNTITLPAGDTTATITVSAIPDALPEVDETVTVTLLPGVDFTPSAAATVTLRDPPIDAWRASFFTPLQLADLEVSGDNADPDGDGVRVLTEYALGLNPLLPEPAATQTGFDPTGHLTLTFRRLLSATDVTLTPEGAMNLGAWSGAPDMVEEIARVPEGAFDRVTVRLVPLRPNAGFLRLRVTRP